jgi:hypothetical protein
MKKCINCKKCSPSIKSDNGPPKVVYYCREKVIDLSNIENIDTFESECDKYKPKYIEFPIIVKEINVDKDSAYSKGPDRRKIGKFVSIRPCAEEYDNKTYLGIYLGEIAQLIRVSFHSEEQKLEVSNSMYNPAIYVFDLKIIIFGCASWWSVISSPEQLKEIKDLDIENVWYVRAMKDLLKGDSSEEVS